MKNKGLKKVNVVYLLNGSIGDFLMAIFFFESIKENNDLSFFIATPKNIKNFKELAECYPRISIVPSKFSLFHFLFQRNIMITTPTPGKHPFWLELFGFLLTRVPGGTFVGFSKRKYFYNLNLPFDNSKLFIDSILEIPSKVGLAFSKPVLKLSYSRRENLPIKSLSNTHTLTEQGKWQ